MTRAQSDEMPFHEVAALFPLLDGAAFEDLKADIRANGLREPIWTWQGAIIDGRNRYRACRAVGVEPRFREWDGQGSLVEFVVSLNLHRRHLTSSQLAAVAADMLPMLEAEAKERQRRHGGTAPGRKAGTLPQTVAVVSGEAREVAARLAGTNKQYVAQARRLREHAPELLEKVRNGSMTVPQASRALSRQDRLADLADRAEAAEQQGAAGTWELRNGDCVEVLDSLEPGTVRLVATDPPYNEGVDYGNGEAADKLPDDVYLGWCERWLALCSRALTPDGSLWVLISEDYADHFGLLLRKVGLHRRRWLVWEEMFGVHLGTNFGRCARHLFYCVKDPERFVFHEHAVRVPSARQTVYGDSRADPAGRIMSNVLHFSRITDNNPERVPGFPTQLPLDLLRIIVGCASDPGDLVLDPFAGSGTTGVACIEAGRRFLGIERQEKFVQLARQRLLTTEAKGPA